VYDGADSGESRSLTTEYSEQLGTAQDPGGAVIKAGSVPPIVHEELRNEPNGRRLSMRKLRNEPNGRGMEVRNFETNPRFVETKGKSLIVSVFQSCSRAGAAEFGGAYIPMEVSLYGGRNTTLQVEAYAEATFRPA